jgi:hypothetical protein
MAWEQRVSAIVCLREPYAFFSSHSLANGQLKMTSRYMPIVIDSEGVNVRDAVSSGMIRTFRAA